MKNINLCLIGSGRAGIIHGRNFVNRVPGAGLTSICEPSAVNASSALQELGITRNYENYRDALKDPAIDAVIIATPTSFHCEIAVAAAQAGKHILCEKPMAMDVDECLAIGRAVAESGVIFQIGFMRRFDRNFCAAKARIDQGDIGPVVMVESHTYGPSIPKPWMYDLTKSNGPLAEVNSHDIDALRWFTGSEFREVFAIAGNYRCPDARAEFPDFYDNVVLSATFANNTQGIIGGAQGVCYGYDSRCEILGKSGIIQVGSLNDTNTVTWGPNGMNGSIVKSWMNLYADAYLAEDQDFVDCIANNRQPRVSARDGMMAVQVVNAGNLSIHTKKPVELEPLEI
jgi:predicted dehydrogenase